MRIVIETNGIGDETSIKINDVEETELKFFELSVNVERSNRVKIWMVKKVDGRYIPINFYGEDVQKFDQADQMTKESLLNGKHIGSKKA